MQTVFYREKSAAISEKCGSRVMIGGYPSVRGGFRSYQAAIDLNGKTIKRDFTPEEFSFPAAEQWLLEVAARHRG